MYMQGVRRVLKSIKKGYIDLAKMKAVKKY